MTLGLPTNHLNAPLDIADDAILTRIMLAVARRTDALRVAQFAEQRALRNPGNTLARAIATHCRALTEESRSLAEAAIEDLRLAARPLPLAVALEDLGRLAADSDLATARSAWAEAHSIYQNLDARRAAARMRSRLRGIGVLVARPRARSESVLTGTETEVARLVAERMTTNDIARELSLSPHTIVTHIRHAYTKLGISSRAELARFYRQSVGPGESTSDETR